MQKQTTKRVGLGQGADSSSKKPVQQRGAGRTRRPKHAQAGRDWSHVKDLGNKPYSPAHLLALEAMLFGISGAGPAPCLGAEILEELKAHHGMWCIGAVDQSGKVRLPAYINSACAIRGFRAGDVVATVLAKNDAATRRGEAPGVAIVGLKTDEYRVLNADPVLLYESLVEVVDYMADQYIAGEKA